MFPYVNWFNYAKKPNNIKDTHFILKWLYTVLGTEYVHFVQQQVHKTSPISYYHGLEF